MFRFFSKNILYCLIVLIVGFSATSSQPKKATFKDFFNGFKTALKNDNKEILSEMIHFNLLKLTVGPEGTIFEYITKSKFLSEYKNIEFVKYKSKVLKFSAPKCIEFEKLKMFAIDLNIEPDENSTDPWTQMTVEVAKDIPNGTTIYELLYIIKLSDEYPCSLQFAKINGEFKLF